MSDELREQAREDEELLAAVQRLAEALERADVQAFSAAVAMGDISGAASALGMDKSDLQKLREQLWTKASEYAERYPQLREAAELLRRRL